MPADNSLFEKSSVFLESASKFFKILQNTFRRRGHLGEEKLVGQIVFGGSD
jgi:hypothetical protein